MVHIESISMRSKLIPSLLLCMAFAHLEATKPTIYDANSDQEAPEEEHWSVGELVLPAKGEQPQDGHKCNTVIKDSQEESEKWHLKAELDDTTYDEFLSSMKLSEKHKPKDEYHEPGYELINYRFWDDKVDDNGERTTPSNRKEQMDNNWIIWRNIFAYFPSGQELLQRHHEGVKTHFEVQNQIVQAPLHKKAFEEPPPAKSGKELVVTTVPTSKEQPSKELSAPPEVIEVAKKEHQSERNEMEQQLQLKAPNLVYFDEAAKVSRPLEEEAKREATTTSSIRQHQQQATDATPLRAFPSPPRAKASLLNAADVARNLALRSSNFTSSGPRTSRDSNVTMTTTTTTTTDVGGATFTESFSASGHELPFSSRRREIGTSQSLPAPNSRSPTVAAEAHEIDGLKLRPKFLGFGQLQKNEPFNGNRRFQARLSCQFANETSASNVTISNVEWNRFVGDYELIEGEEPAFLCRRRQCKLIQVKTDTRTTVHPRPALQSYINTMVPSYSLTLHDIDNSQLGVYRCSAMRQRMADGQIDLVYRIIPIE